MTADKTLDDQTLWERQPSEPNEWYRRFHKYLMLSGKRSLLAAYNCERVEKGRKRTTTCPDSWRNAFKQWRWEERAAHWDDYNRTLELEEWGRKRRQLREQQWELAQAGIDKARGMLKMPIVTQTTVDGQIVITSAKWTFRDAIAILSDSYALAREAAQMSTLKEEEALQVLVDLGVLPSEVLIIGSNALRSATQEILDAITCGNQQYQACQPAPGTVDGYSELATKVV